MWGSYGGKKLKALLETLLRTLSSHKKRLHTPDLCPSSWMQEADTLSLPQHCCYWIIANIKPCFSGEIKDIRRWEENMDYWGLAGECWAALCISEQRWQCGVTLTAHFCIGDAQSISALWLVSILCNRTRKCQNNGLLTMSKHLSMCGGFGADLWDLLFLARRSCSLDTHETCQKPVPTYLSELLSSWCPKIFLGFDDPAHFSPGCRQKHWLADMCRLLTPTSKRMKLGSYFIHHKLPQTTLFPQAFPPFHEDADDSELIEMVYLRGSSQSFLCPVIHHTSWLVNIQMQQTSLSLPSKTYMD